MCDRSQIRGCDSNANKLEARGCVGYLTEYKVDPYFQIIKTTGLASAPGKH